MFKRGSGTLAGRFLRGVAAGTLIGAAAGMLLIPRMDKKTRKKISKAGRRAAEFTSDIWGGLRNSRG
jgi:gas vesicle protein